LQIRLTTYLREAYILPLVSCAPLIIILLLMKQWFIPHNYLGLLAHLSAAGLVYALTMLWAFKSKRAMRVGDLQASASAAVTQVL
jgi:hypothetical protein